MLRIALRLLLAWLFVAAGWAHFARPEPFVGIMPGWIPAPWHRPLVYLSGVLELVGGAGLLLNPTLRPAVLLLELLLVGVFPANLNMAMNGVKFAGWPPQPWMAWARLPLQGVLMALLAWVGGWLE